MIDHAGRARIESLEAEVASLRELVDAGGRAVDALQSIGDQCKALLDAVTAERDAMRLVVEAARHWNATKEVGRPSPGYVFALASAQASSDLADRIDEYEAALAAAKREG